MWPERILNGLLTPEQGMLYSFLLLTVGVMLTWTGWHRLRYERKAVAYYRLPHPQRLVYLWLKLDPTTIQKKKPLSPQATQPKASEIDAIVIPKPIRATRRRRLRTLQTTLDLTSHPAYAAPQQKTA